MASDPPKVLISYSHDSLEHRDRVLVFQAPPQGRMIFTIGQYVCRGAC